MKKSTVILSVLGIAVVAVAAFIVYYATVDVPAPRAQKEIVLDHGQYIQ